jgi:hypothetical protein
MNFFYLSYRFILMKRIILLTIVILVESVSYSQIVYRFNKNGNWNDSANWQNNSVPPDTLTGGAEIIIDTNKICYLNIPQTISAGASLIVLPGADLIIKDNLIDYNIYRDTTNTFATDTFPNKVGDTWLYLVNDTTVNGQDSTASQYNMTVSIINSTQLTDGTKANVWVYNYPGSSDTNYVFQTGDTVRFLDNTRSYTVRQYIIPLSLHNSWQYAPGINDVTVDTQSNIIVANIHFDNAFNIDGSAGYPDGIYGIDEWIENNVGVVKRYLNPYGEALILRHIIAWSLINFHLK